MLAAFLAGPNNFYSSFSPLSFSLPFISFFLIFLSLKSIKKKMKNQPRRFPAFKEVYSISGMQVKGEINYLLFYFC